MILAAVCICPKIKQLNVPWKWTDDMRRKLQVLGCSSCFLLAFIIMGIAGFSDGSSTSVDTGSDINRSIPVVDDDIQTTTTTELTTTSTTTTTTTTATTTAETTTEETSTVVTTTEIITTEPPTEPPTDPPPPPQTVAQRSYVVNTNSGKVHYPDCNSVDDMLEENKWYYTGSFAELEGMGYTSCGRCHAR